MSTTIADTPPTTIQSKLGWAFSLYAGVFAFLYSILIFSPLSGLPFAAISAVSAFICVRIASWLASYFGRSGYGLVACVITAFLFPLVPPLVVMSGALHERLTEPSISSTFVEFGELSAAYYLIGFIYAAPAVLAGTATFQLALVIVRKLRWLTFDQLWI
jgi:hypothetical protein